MEYTSRLKLNIITTCLIIFISICTTAKAQVSSNSDTIIESYNSFSKVSREVVYAHLNKSTYVNGEMLGFTTYVFDKFSKKRSQLTTNLYCTISDLDGKIIKKKLIHIKDGVASNIFHLDENLLSGTFVFKAYTNWMLNFEEQNHYQQLFNILDADKQSQIASKTIDNQLDIQILGEGGHFIYNTLNTAGVIVRNKSGRGLANASAEIIDDKELVINSFKLNPFGIAKIILSPEQNRRYFLKVYHNDSYEKIEIKEIKKNGFNMSVTDIKDNILISFTTNRNSQDLLKTKRFKLAIHNGNDMFIVPFHMRELSEKLMINKSDLFSGINILTVFDENNTPILERLVFNHFGIDRGQTQFVSSILEKDSLNITLKVDKHQLNNFQNVSISVLPSDTKSYNHQHNLISQIYLQPYIKTPIEDAGYYFKDDNRKTKHQLDNLLLTQGWSSYNWGTIFSNNTTYKHAFEEGISVTSNINGKTKSGTYISYPLKSSSSKIYTITEEDKVILSKNLIPTKDEAFKIGFINKKGEPRAPTIYPQFYPSVFPMFNKTYDFIQPHTSEITSDLTIPKTPSSWSTIESLDEVVVTAKKENTRIQKLKDKAINSKIFEITDYDRQRSTPLHIYFSSIGFIAEYSYISGEYIIINPRSRKGRAVPTLYLDDALIPKSDFDILSTLSLSNIDYIEVDYQGATGGYINQGGYIKLYTSPEYLYRNPSKYNTVASFEFPLVFDEEKQFYTPKYQFYNTDFFNEYGTIDWKPKLKAAKDGMIRFKIANTGTDRFNLYINGIVNDNTFLSEIITINTDNSN